MKTIYKVFTIIVSIVLLIYSLFLLMRHNAVKNMEKYRSEAEMEWVELFTHAEWRLGLIRDLLSVGEVTQDPQFVELSSALKKNLTDRQRFRNECDLAYVKLEHDVNEAFVNLSPYLSGVNKSAVDILQSDNAVINNMREQYNNSVERYNKYVTIFPNFFYAKKKGFKRLRYFAIKYGESNVDPIVQASEKPEWMKKVDEKYGIE